MTRKPEKESVLPNDGGFERPQLRFSDQAAKKVRALTMEEANEDLGYGFSFPVEVALD